MLNKILHFWSFHVKFMKLALFDKFISYEMTACVISSIYGLQHKKDFKIYVNSNGSD